MGLREYPDVNASLAADGEALLQHGDHNLGVAMDTPAGLVVPNVKRVQQRSIRDIAAELTRLQVRYRLRLWMTRVRRILAPERASSAQSNSCIRA